VLDLEKVGAYFRITETLVIAAEKYKPQIVGMNIEYLPPFKPVWSHISMKVKMVSYYVHGEVQPLKRKKAEPLRYKRQPVPRLHCQDMC
jgi:hypothetical protein